MQTKIKTAFLLLALTTSAAIFLPNTSSAKEIELSAPIQANPKVLRGKLPNGLRYVILPNDKPGQRVSLRLVVDAGSINETDEQTGLAHFLEHMAFNGTSHFPKNTLIDELQHLGVAVGADLNAHTGYKKTTYKLSIPLNKPDNLDKGLLILNDWAFHISLQPAAVDAERPVVLEEWRVRTQSPEKEVYKRNDALMLKDSIYPSRPPIGTPENIQHFKLDALKAFYKKWYRPNRMSIVIVGDINPKQVQKKSSRFSRMPQAKRRLLRSQPIRFPTTKNRLLAFLLIPH
jgi:zinc protease